MTDDRVSGSSIAVTGAGGMLGRSIAARLHQLDSEAPSPDDGSPGIVPLDRAALDVTDRTAVLETLGVHRPDLVFHCAAWTAVDAAESHPEEARRVNAEGTRNVIEAADAAGARVVHFSTDYVFGATVTAGVPILVDAPRAPVSVYGRTKSEAEEAVLASPGRHLIVRTAWLFGPGGKNFVDTMIGLADREEIRVVADQTGSPTWTPDLAEAAVELAATDLTGVVHVTNAGHTTWHAFAERIFERLGHGPRVVPVTTEEYGAPATRPAWSVLDLSRAEKVLGRPMRGWKEALDEHLSRGRG